MNFYGQHGEDNWLWDHAANLRLPMRGVFVDVGAGNGRECSNTLWLEEQGWSGLCIEPDPRHADGLQRNRRCKLSHAAVGDPARSRTFYLAGDPHLSGFRNPVGEAHPVSVASLADLCRSFGIERIDVLSIDTEGTELDVWATLPTELRPPIVIVEWMTMGLPPQDAELIDVFTRDGYALATRLGGNLIVTRRLSSTP